MKLHVVDGNNWPKGMRWGRKRFTELLPPKVIMNFCLLK